MVGFNSPLAESSGTLQSPDKPYIYSLPGLEHAGLQKLHQPAVGLNCSDLRLFGPSH